MRPKLCVNKATPSQQAGFSLLELAIALMILMVLMVATVLVVQNQRSYDRVLENTVYMNTVQSALIIFVKTNGFLPCPDVSGDGKEDRNLATPFECTSDSGGLPFLDLGLPEVDAWGQPVFYAVNREADSSGILEITNARESAAYFNNQLAPNPFFNLQTRPFGNDDIGVGTYGICGEQTLPTLTTCNEVDLIEDAAIALVVSFGQNGAAAWAAINSGVSTGLDNAEAENVDGDKWFWKAAGSERAGARFDDQLIWITAWDVKYAIMSSGGNLDLTPPP